MTMPDDTQRPESKIIARVSESARRALWPLRVAVLTVAAFAASNAIAADHIRVATQKTGTLAWELDFWGLFRRAVESYLRAAGEDLLLDDGVHARQVRIAHLLGDEVDA